MELRELLSNLEMIEEISRAPLYNPLEVGFRHSPLSPKEQLERYADACRIINTHAVYMIERLSS